MKFKLTNNMSPLSLLEKLSLDEDVTPDVSPTEVLYEDNDFSKTPEEADNYRTAAEEVLGIELDGNQVQYLAENNKGFYHNAHKFAFMKDSILQCLSEAGLLTDEELEQATLSDDGDDMFDEDSPIEDSGSGIPSSDAAPGIDDVDDNFDLNFSDNELARMKSIDGPVPVQSTDITPNQSFEQSTAPASDEPMSTQQELDDMANSTVDVDDDDDISVEELNKVLMGS